MLLASVVVFVPRQRRIIAALPAQSADIEAMLLRWISNLGNTLLAVTPFALLVVATITCGA